MNTHLPYSRQGLERLAVALGVNSAQIWFEPSRGRLETRNLPGPNSTKYYPQEANHDEDDEN